MSYSTAFSTQLLSSTSVCFCLPPDPVMKVLVVLACFCAAAYAQRNSGTTPVPILKQINRHNDDGSYSYGYEGADGTFKIETKYSTGEVYGKYGYVGDDGKVREIEYGATRRGFEPMGTDINVPPPTVTKNLDANSLDYDDGQYREDPAVYNKYKGASKNRQPLQRFNYNNVAANPTPAPAPVYNPPQAHYNPPAPVHYNPPAPTYSYNSPPAPAYRYNSPPAHTFNNNQHFQGHPATNVNLQTGSYSLSYSG